MGVIPPSLTQAASFLKALAYFFIAHCPAFFARLGLVYRMVRVRVRSEPLLAVLVPRKSFATAFVFVPLLEQQLDRLLIKSVQLSVLACTINPTVGSLK
jgi:hypothetical protein